MESKTPEQAMVERIADRLPKFLRALRELEQREVAAGRDPADSHECDDALSEMVWWIEENLPGIDDLDPDTFIEDLIGQAVERVCGPMRVPVERLRANADAALARLDAAKRSLCSCGTGSPSDHAPDCGWVSGAEARVAAARLAYCDALRALGQEVAR